ncbi:MAG: nitrous oxide reductase family maturation protein NosD [Candidatus Heimdallarchaeota archaeon]
MDQQEEYTSQTMESPGGLDGLIDEQGSLNKQIVETGHFPSVESQLSEKKGSQRLKLLGGSGDYIPPTSGDWSITTDTIVYDAIITLNGSLVIQNGANLTLQNVTLRMNCTFDGEYNITVHNGAGLTISGNSTVTALDPSDAWFLNVITGSTLQLENSTFSFAGWDWSNHGVRIKTNGARVINSTFRNNFYGLYFTQANNSLIANNTFTNSSGSGISLDSSNDAIISGNTLINTTWGISLLGNSYNGLIFDNAVSNNTAQGISIDAPGIQSNSTISGNTVTNGGDDGIRVYSENCTVSGNTVSGSARGISLNASRWLTVSDNTILDSSYYGIAISSSYSSILRNTINNSDHSGIRVWWSNTNTNTISGNIVNHSLVYGLYLEESVNNYVRENIFANSGSLSVYVSSNSFSDRIFLNDLLDGAEDYGSFTSFTFNLLGNYWGSGFAVLDSDGDGFNDTAHSFTGGTDFYPLIYPTERYWVVDTKQTVENEDITFVGYLLIKSGGNLTLDNVTLRINSSTDGEYRIEVYDGGRLTIQENSTVTAFNPAHAWYLKVNPGSFLVLMDSTFSYAGWASGTNGNSSGLWINTDGVQIINCTIHHNFVGLYLYQVENSLIINNTVTNSSQVGLYLDSSAFGTLNGNIFANNTGYGLYLNDMTGSCTLWANVLVSNVGGNAYDANGTNLWEYNARGNWWDDHAGIDTDYDGCGDQPYSLPGGAGAEDRYPLIHLPDFDLARPSIDMPWDFAYEMGTVDHNITWQPSDNNPAGYRIYQNDSPGTIIDWDGSTITIVVDGLGLGVYNFTLVVRDVAGNWASDTVWVTVIDTTPPTVIITSPTNVTYTTSTIWLNFSGDAVHYWYYIESADTTNQSWTVDVNRTLIDGTYTLHAYGNDSVGNEAHALVTFSIETPDPKVLIDSPISMIYANSTVLISLSGNASHYWYYIAGIDSANHTWTGNTTRGELSDGIYTLHAYGNDSVGNEVQSNVMFTIDTTAPTIIIDSPFNATYSKLTINVTLSGDAVHYWYQLIGPSGHGNATWTAPVQEIDLGDGIYTLYAYGVDLVGNEGQKQVIFTIARDSTVLNEVIDEIAGTNNTFEISNTITLSIEVWNTTTLTVKQVTVAPETPSTLDSLGIYLNITLSDPSTLAELWINVSFAEVPEEQDPYDAQIYYYDENTLTWELVQETGVDFENEIIWGRVDHLTTFGVMVPHVRSVQEDDWLLPLMGVGLLALIVGGIAVLRYSNLKEQVKRLRRREREEDWQDRL